jgi:Polysaccharide lyase 14
MATFEEGIAIAEKAYADSLLQVSSLQKQLADCQAQLVPKETVLLSVDFSDLPAGPFTQAMAKAKFAPNVAWTPPANSWWASKYVTIVKADGVSVLDVNLKAGSYGGGGGPVFYVPLVKKVSDITFKMRQRFAPGFDLKDGGKLPGTGITTTTANPPTGGNPPTTGSTCRHMWRTKGEAGTRPPGACACYTYHPGQKTVYGDYEFLEKNFTVGEWDDITTRQKNNTVGVDNGILQSKKGSGDWTLNLNNYRWILAENWLWSHLCFEVFRGGGAPWAASTDGHVQFQNILITTPA